MTRPDPQVRTDPPAAPGGPAAPPAAQPAGLTYRDLQRTVLLAAALFVFFHYAEALSTLLLFFLLVFILSAVLNPAVVWLERRRIPRIVGAVMLVLVGLLSIVLLGYFSLPPLLSELKGFAANLSHRQGDVEEWYADKIAQYPLLDEYLPPPDQIAGRVGGRLQPLLGQVGRYTMNVAVGLVSLVLMMVLVIFTSAQPAPLLAGALAAVPHRHRPRAERAATRILQQLKNWARGSLILGVIVGVVVGIALKLIGIPYAFLFGVIAGIGELIPNIGPILTAVPPALMGLTAHDPKLALWVLVVFLVVQQVENTFLVPLIMGQTLNLHPVSVTFTVLVMGALFGLLGAILAVPVCAIVKVLWEEFYLAPQGIDVEGIERNVELLLREDSPDRKDHPPSEDLTGEA